MGGNFVSQLNVSLSYMEYHISEIPGPLLQKISPFCYIRYAIILTSSDHLIICLSQKVHQSLPTF